MLGEVRPGILNRSPAPPGDAGVLPTRSHDAGLMDLFWPAHTDLRPPNSARQRRLGTAVAVIDPLSERLDARHPARGSRA